jgi:hypothetical protein
MRERGCSIAYHNSNDPTNAAKSPIQLGQQIVHPVPLVVPPLPAPLDRDPAAAALLLVLGDGAQDLLELLLGHAPAQLARPRERDEPRLDVGRARGLDEPDAPEPLGGVRGEDLGEEGGAGFGFGVPAREGRASEACREGRGGRALLVVGRGAGACLPTGGGLLLLQLGEAGLADLRGGVSVAAGLEVGRGVYFFEVGVGHFRASGELGRWGDVRGLM